MLVCCGQPSASHSEKLNLEIMEVHDRLMPKMGELYKWEKKLRAEALNSPYSALFLRHAEAIAEANEYMMDWMRNFKVNFEGTEQEKEQYLLTQKQGIEQVQLLMTTSLEEAKKYLINRAL